MKDVYHHIVNLLILMILNNIPRSDAVIYTPSTTYLLDVAIPHPTSPSYINKAKNQPALTIAKAREKEKHHKYDNIAKQQEATFIPFVMESYGGIGVEAMQFIKILAGFIATNLHISNISAQQLICRRLSVALQIGNARIMTAWTQKSRQADHFQVTHYRLSSST